LEILISYFGVRDPKSGKKYKIQNKPTTKEGTSFCIYPLAGAGAGAGAMRESGIQGASSP